MDIYILTDGLCETPKILTSLMQSRHPYLDQLTQYGRLGFYEPIVKNFQSNPETFVVFPYFFWLNPENNPWRSGLEFYASGVGITQYSFFCIVRIVRKEHNIFDVADPIKIWNSWTSISNIQDIDQIEEIFKKVEIFLPKCKSIKSKNRMNVWSLWAHDKNDLELMINLLQYEINKLWYNVYPMLFDSFSSRLTRLHQPKKRTSILWWCVSSLLEALQLAWVHNQQVWKDIKTKLFDYQYKHHDFDTVILPLLKEKQNTKEAFILFIKEPSRAARENISPDLKIESIIFIDELVWKILAVFKNTNTNIIVLSDHQSNIGDKKTYSWPTLYYYGNLLSKKYIQHHFSENIQFTTISQKKLVNNIKNFIIKNDNINT